MQSNTTPEPTGTRLVLEYFFPVLKSDGSAKYQKLWFHPTKEQDLLTYKLFSQFLTEKRNNITEYLDIISEIIFTKK